MNERIVLVKNFPNRGFAEQAQAILEKNNIASVLKSPDVGILGTRGTGGIHGVDLYVEEKDYNRAFQLINALFNGI